MPFIGRDWRSPGEAWVKTESLGWQRMKIIESQLYLTCHQNHSNACSWPPRSQFGQHMETNCGKQQDTGNQLADSTDGGATSSAGSSQTSSASTSPTGTPEKNNARHIHPITISSPYGRFSTTCCARGNHDSNNSATGSPCKSPSGQNRMGASTECHRHHHHHHPQHPRLTTNDNVCAQVMSRSLSRETVSSPTANFVCLSTNQASPSPKLRYNNSVSDFRDTLERFNGPSSFSSKDNEDQQSKCDNRPLKPEQDKSKSSLPDMAACPNQPRYHVTAQTPPTLMKNGARMNADEAKQDVQELKPPALGVMNPTSEPEVHHGISPSVSRSPSPQPLATSPKSDGESATSADKSLCNCCCCCSTTSNVANSHHLMMEMQQPKTAPHCQISVRTREVAMHNTISEAFYRLDFYNAIHDIRRFNYICKLLHLLITQNLTSLSGCATRVLFTMLEQVAWEVSSNKRNVHVIRNLLNELKQTIQKYYCWGRPIGSSLLWQQHFETIERISQIVNGIELAPPKGDSYKVTFDKLPVEMVREILLRLDDYRDLINSAQASPVMQTMIDSQSIWQKLCRYHFTEQQLKLALESGKNSILVKKNTPPRGIKYARTTSADGRSSYRNPVAHMQASSSFPSASSSSLTDSPLAAAAGAAARTAATRRQLSETAGRRGSNADRRGNGSDSSGAQRPSTSSSYVTNAVRIFDDRQRGVVRPSSEANKARWTPRSSTSGRNIAGSRRASLMKTESGQATTSGRSMDLDNSKVEIDWERVFHQLRKRFDLKEEYADCLLLCRHCRCLFWKSFGHPCIKGDDMRQQPNASRQPSTNKLSGPGRATDVAPGAAMGASRNNAQQRDNDHAATSSTGRSRLDQSRAARDNSGGASTSSLSSSHGRPSVALLSRSFDRATRNSLGNNGAVGLAASAAPGDENAQPPTGGGQQRGDLRQRFAADEAPGQRPRQPLNNLNAQLREHNVNRQLRQAHLPPTGRDNNGLATGAARREELVPKHVTVTPQAFLKFFSL